MSDTDTPTVLIRAEINELNPKPSQPLIGVRIKGNGRIIHVSIPREAIKEIDKQAALDAYWAAKTPDEVRAAVARMVKLGMWAEDRPSQTESPREPGFYWLNLGAVYTDAKPRVAEWTGQRWICGEMVSQDLEACPVMGERLLPPVAR